MHAIQEFLLQEVEAHPADLVKITMEKFGVTRAAVFFHIQKLKSVGLILQEGTRNKTTYRLGKEASSDSLESWYAVGERGEDDIWKNDIKPQLPALAPNVEDICQYGFTEIYNNVIDHSQSKQALVQIICDGTRLKINVHDFGIGVYKNIATFFGLNDMREAVLRLHQGKVTTDKSRHTGQGIFFTSRAFDNFILLANGFRYIKDNSRDDDWYWERQDEADKEVGTMVSMEIQISSKRILKDVFDAYTNPEDYAFDKSRIRIELGLYEEDKFVSRSQAKRLLAGLKEFKTITLDFKNIKNVGQAFVDEVFGVFGLQFPEISFEVVSANPDIIFMIKRGLKERHFPENRVSFE
jgi:hypothetical protein